METVSIILPTYNGEKYIREAIASCLSQTYDKLELIAVDDGSTDSTPDILASYHEPRMRIVHHEVNRRLPAALNTGFAHAQGELFMWMADDDLLAPDAIEQLAGFLQRNPQVDAVYADYGCIDAGGNLTRIVSITLSPERVREENMSSPAFMYRRKVYQALGGYDPAWYLVEDYRFWLLTWLHFGIAYLPTPWPLYYLREHEHTLTSEYSYPHIHRLAIQLRKELLNLSWLEVQRQISQVEIHQAFDNYRCGNRWGTLRHVLAAMWRNPRWLGNRGVLAITVRSLMPFLR
ncbi:MAG: glycosyltransferase family 2 protein [Candidatus Oleimicrobiaceae bacterium]